MALRNNTEGMACSKVFSYRYPKESFIFTNCLTHMNFTKINTHEFQSLLKLLPHEMKIGSEFKIATAISILNSLYVHKIP